MKTGGQILVDALCTQAVTRVFCVPGESFLPVLDALYDSTIHTTVGRQEGGTAMMAEAWGKLTGTPGVCFVTRGPGATNAAAGIHIAAQDSTPMVLFIGQINSSVRHREAFQELDYTQFFGGMAKWVAEIDTTSRIDELVSRAWHIATSGRPGPVVLVLPEDTLNGRCQPGSLTYWNQIEAHPGSAQMESFHKLIQSAASPIAIVGGSRWSAAAVTEFSQYAEQWDLPVAVSFRRQMLFDHTHQNYAGDVGLGINPALKYRIQQADLVVLLGTRLSEIASQDYTLLGVPDPAQQIIHIHPGVEELGKVYKPTLGIQASPIDFCRALQPLPVPQETCNTNRSSLAHTEYLEWSSLRHAVPAASLMRDIMIHLQQELPMDAVLTNGAGNYASWIHRFWKFKKFATQLAPTCGSMGYGLPAAIAAKLESPEKTVVAFAGDGCFQMTCQEFGTAIQVAAAIIVIVVDNSMYGTIRMHQERNYPGRISATQLTNPDFAAWAHSYGAYAASITEFEQFPSAFATACASSKPSLLHIKVNPDAITPTQSLTTMQN